MQKYYFITYQVGGSKYNDFIDIHPLEWLKFNKSISPSVVLLDYKDITEEQYKLFNGE